MGQLRADLEMVWRSVSGRHPAPYEDRRGRTASRWVATRAPARVAVARAPQPGLLEGATHVVERRVEETEDAVSLWLRPERRDAPRVRPGQFYTVRVPHPDGVLKRAYSASHNCSDAGRLRLTIQRVADGRASTYLTEHVREGATLRLLGPSGRFGEALLEGDVRRVVMIAGGSGVTPMAAICHSLLDAASSRYEFVLIHGVRTPRHALLAQELDDLARARRGRLFIHRVYERDGPPGSAMEGRLVPEVLSEALDAALASLSAPPERYLVCGPAGLLESARVTLRGRGVAADQIDEERFASPEIDERSSEEQGQTTLTFISGERSSQVEVAASDTILKSGIEAGVQMPFSCTMGGCGACKVKLVDGAVAMETPNCLTDRERAAGDVLACVARATGPCVIEVPQ